MTMENYNKNTAGSDDDDIESLRLAALKSLKPKTTNLNVYKIVENKHQHPYKPSFGAAQTTRHHNRGFRNNSGRAGRNGLSSRIRTNTNLISIQTIDHEQSDPSKFLKPPSLTTTKEVPKLILPQDRYHKPLAETEQITKESSNKFNRYNDHDNSDESESDSSEPVSPQKPVKRERKDSLEMLMEKLDNEINVLEGKEIKSSEPDVTVKEEPKSPGDNQSDKVDGMTDSLIINESESDLVPSENEVNIKVDIKTEMKSRSPSPYQSIQRSVSPRPKSGRSPKGTKSPIGRSRSPIGARSPIGRSRSPRGVRSPTGRSRSPKACFNSPKGHLNSPKGRSRSPKPLFESQYRSPRNSPPRKNRYSPNRGYRPLSPLAINTEVLNAVTMAPLSPRSAAFVLENRQILARRQKSPMRRSLSRDRSCSLSPKRSRQSPLRRRSPPPRFESGKCSLSPRNRSFSPRMSPKRRSTSPRTRRSPPRLSKRPSNNKRAESPKASVHKRLGSRPVSRNPSPLFEKNAELNKRKRASRSISLSLSPSPDRNYHKRPLNETTGYIPVETRRNREKTRKDSPGKLSRNGVKVEKVDAVLEARKRKFESPVQIEKNGIIKLKTKTDGILEDNKDELQSAEEEFEEEDEQSEAEMDDSVLDLNPNMDDLWSDEESDNENEGRFKSKPTLHTNKILTILPFRKLLDKPNLKQPLLPKDNSDHRIDQRRYAKRPRTSRRSPPRSSEQKTSHRTIQDRKKEDSKVNIVEPKKMKSPGIEKKKERKEEVKQVENVEKSIPRKVKIQTEIEVAKVVEADDEPDIIIENEDEVNHKDEDGDLRAELSRRRAERLIKAGSIGESLPTRLLKNALQEVVPRSSSKHTKTAKGDSSSTDRRVLILKRLASSPVTQLEPANNKVSKKEKKLPIHMRLGSSNALDLPLDEIVRSDRRPKRIRSNRRNKKAGVQV